MRGWFGHKFAIFNDIFVEGQSKIDRWQMIRVLRSLGQFVDSLRTNGIGFSV